MPSRNLLSKSLTSRQRSSATRHVELPSPQTSSGSTARILELQRSIGNTAALEYLRRVEVRNLPTVQRAGVKDRWKFEGGGSSLERNDKSNGLLELKNTERSIGFDQARALFDQGGRLETATPKTQSGPTLTDNSTTVDGRTETSETPNSTDNAQSNDSLLSTETSLGLSDEKTLSGTTSDTGSTSSISSEDAKTDGRPISTDEPPEPKDDEAAPSTPTDTDDLESLQGGAWQGRKLRAEYRKGEKYRHNREVEGFARASWEGSGDQLVKYLSEEQRASYELKMHKGTNLFFWRGEPLDTAKMKRGSTFAGRSGDSRVLFVMAVDGSIYVADEFEEGVAGFNNKKNNNGEQWRFNHSSFVEGKRVAGAGELIFEAGVLKGVTDNSGHYKPGLAEMVQVLRHFKKAGADVGRVAVERHSGDKDQWGRPRYETIDGESLLQRGGAQLTQDALSDIDDSFSELSTNTTLESDLDDDDFSNVTPRLQSVAEQIQVLALQETSDVRAKLAKLVGELQRFAPNLAGQLSEGSGRSISRRRSRADAKAMQQTVRIIDEVSVGMLSDQVFDSIDELLGELNDLDEVDDHGERDYTAARQHAIDFASALAAVQPSRQPDTAPGLEQESKSRVSGLSDLEEDVPKALAGIDGLVNAPHSIAKLAALYTANKAGFGAAVRTAAVRGRDNLDAVISGFKDIAIESEGTRRNVVLMVEAIQPGLGTEFKDESLTAKVNLAGVKFRKYFDRFDASENIGEVAFFFAEKLMIEDGSDYEIALLEVLRERGQQNKKVADVYSFISTLLIPGMDSDEEQDIIDDALEIAAAANRLRANSVSDARIAELEDKKDD